MNKPFFSIIIPVHNRPAFIKISIESALAQTYSDFEVIVVDDGSNDNTPSIINSYAATTPRLRCIRQVNQGPAAARNTGIRHARGEWICFLDSDDRFRIDKLNITREYIAKHHQYKIFHTQEIWYRGGELLPQKIRHNKPHGLIFPEAAKLCCVSISTAVVQKDIFEIIGGFDESMPACEDYDFWLRVSASYPVYLIPKCLTIKEGGRLDQVSKRYPAMDKFRVYALAKIIKSEVLCRQNRIIALKELKEKCAILIPGAQKRGKTEDVNYYKNLIGELS